MPRTTRRRRLLLALLVSLAVPLGLAVLPATSASAAPTVDTDVNVRLSRTWGVFYDGIGPAIPEDTFTVSGRLVTASERTPLAGQTVELWRSKKTEAESTKITEATTDANGQFAFSQRVVGTAQYGIKYPGDGVTYKASESDLAKKVNGMRDFNAGTRKVKGKLYFRGTVKPSWNNRVVTLQKKACGTCPWKSVASKRTGSRGGWSFRVYYPSKVGPTWRWQVVLRAAGDFEKSYSAQLTTRRVYGRAAAQVG